MAPSDKTNLKQEALAERRAVSVIFQKVQFTKMRFKITQNVCQIRELQYINQN